MWRPVKSWVTTRTLIFSSCLGHPKFTKRIGQISTGHPVPSLAPAAPPGKPRCWLGAVIFGRVSINVTKFCIPAGRKLTALLPAVCLTPIACQYFPHPPGTRLCHRFSRNKHTYRWGWDSSSSPHPGVWLRFPSGGPGAKRTWVLSHHPLTLPLTACLQVLQ